MSYISTIPSLADVLADLSGLKDMLLREDPPTHVVSQLYSLVLNALTPDLPPYMQVWESELHHTVSLRIGKSVLF